MLEPLDLRPELGVFLALAVQFGGDSRWGSGHSLLRPPGGLSVQLSGLRREAKECPSPLAVVHQVYETFVPRAPAVNLVFFNVARPVVDCNNRFVPASFSLSAAAHAVLRERMCSIPPEGWKIREKISEVVSATSQRRRAARYNAQDKDYLDYWRYIVEVV